MAEVTFELDDAIYRKAEEMLAEVGGLEAYLKALVEAFITAWAAGTVGGIAFDQEAQRLIERAKDHAMKSRENGQ